MGAGIHHVHCSPHPPHPPPILQTFSKDFWSKGMKWFFASPPFPRNIYRLGGWSDVSSIIGHWGIQTRGTRFVPPLFLHLSLTCGKCTHQEYRKDCKCFSLYKLSIFVEFSRASALSVLSDGSTNCGILPSRLGEHRECGDHGEHGKDGKHQPDDF